MSTPQSGGTTAPGEPAEAPNFLALDPAAAATQADLGAIGALMIERTQWAFREILRLIDDEAWIDDPVGPLADHWRGTGGKQSTHYLINFASMAWQLFQNVSPGVGRTIKQRLKTVFRPPDDRAYEEALVELEVGSLLSTRISPIELEPLVPKGLGTTSNQPMSPDYGLWLPETRLTVEVTAWRWGEFAKWARMQKAIFQTLSARLKYRNVQRNVLMELPLNSPHDAINWLTNHDFCRKISESESGAVQFTEGTARPITVTWQSAPTFLDSGASMAAMDAFRGTGLARISFSIGEDGRSFKDYFGFSVNPHLTEEDYDSALASIRRKIRDKKEQRDPTLPHLLAISCSNKWITWEFLGPLIEQRLWPNPRYEWLSGILMYSNSRVAAPDETFTYVGYNPNPNAAIPAPDSMMRIMSGEQQCHLMWQRPRRPETP